MDPARQRCLRLVAALEDLTDQEAACVRMSDFARVLELQGRAAPLVTHLVEHGPGVADAVVRQRVAALISRRENTSAEIQRQIEDTRQKLDGLRASQQRIAQVAPVYGRPRPPRPQLRARG